MNEIHLTVSSELSVFEGTTDVGLLQVVDPEGDSISLTTKGDDGSLFQVSETGQISFVSL